MNTGSGHSTTPLAKEESKRYRVVEQLEEETLLKVSMNIFERMEEMRQLPLTEMSNEELSALQKELHAHHNELERIIDVLKRECSHATKEVKQTLSEAVDLQTTLILIKAERIENYIPDVYSKYFPIDPTKIEKRKKMY